ncbi:MAG: radical SAM protein [Nostoc sp. NOS(2021)]|uniref:radical SAM protein n=1 Tax=Nostoc sp. NOS(2021) TaxID=2815407 RepID=UPI0025EA9108|nr:radical SAM protein [Nostoc sp. NOS(2021)]MBN3897475.1 radical SAM protein [Nostoc sp. NOS(2021)]
MNISPRQVQFVVKTSKFCNLRCRYCYEYAELGNKAAIAPEQLEQMFHNIASYYRQLDFPVDIQFVWHGGEPLLQSPDYYWQAFDLQRQIFGELANNITNAVQTNLTVLNPERIRLLKDGFDEVGVSIDLFGGLRVNRSAVDSLDTVLKNMDCLSKANIPFGCITVLTKLNLPYLREIYNFYRTMNLSFRVLPLFKGSFDGQHQGFEISPQETLDAFCTLVDFWLEDQEFVSVVPIVDYIQQVVQHYTPNSSLIFYDKKEWENVYLVNTTGDIYSYADAYEIERSHGNIFTTSLTDLIVGERHQQIIAEAEERMAATCSTCAYFGSCSGSPVAEGSREYNDIDESGAIRCIIDQGTLQHIEYRLKQAGIINPQTGKLDIEQIKLPAFVPSLATAV